MVAKRANGTVDLPKSGKRLTNAVHPDETVEAIGAKAGAKGGKALEMVIPQVNTKYVDVFLKGISPLVIRAWDQKTMQQLADKQAGKKAPKAREAEDPNKTYEGAKYRSHEGWEGIPASAFKAALVDAVSTTGVPLREFNMTLAKKTFFVSPQGVDKLSGRDLLRIYGEPEVYAIMQPTSGGGPYMSYRPMYRNWIINLRVEYNAAKIDSQGVLNLIAAAGFFVGVGEHRPSAKESRTGTFGRWRILPRSEFDELPKEVRDAQDQGAGSTEFDRLSPDVSEG